tara:strand:- start:27 stop:1052 length:1026 start_codon:yes stop_codon:yes gene_type:complete
MTYKVGIVGYGIVGKKRHAAIKKIPDFKVVALSDKSFKGAKESQDFVRYSDFKDLINLEEIDVLFISLPNKFASEATLMALNKDIHVFCEKPPAKSLLELFPIKEKVEGSNLKLMYGFNHRYHLSASKAKQIIDEKSLGKVINLKGSYGKSKMISFNQTDWRTDRQKSGGGILLDQGIHMLDLMNYYAGGFSKIFSIIKNNFWNFDVEDNAFVLMENDNGVVAQLHSSATQWKHTFKLEITLERGSLLLEGILTSSKSYGSERLKIIYSDPDNDRGDPQEEVLHFEEDVSWDLEVLTFADAIRNSANIVNGSIDHAIEIMGLIEKIYKSDLNWKEKFYQND